MCHWQLIAPPAVQVIRHADDKQRMDHAWQEAQQSEQYVDEQLTSTAALQGDRHRGQDECQNRGSASPG